MADQPQPAPRITAPPANLPTPPPVPGAVTPPRPTMPPPPPRQPMPPPVPTAPRPPVPPVPVPPPAAPIQPPVPKPAPQQPQNPSANAGQGGYSSEIRTMSADIGNLKVGQAPAGIRPPTPAAPSVPAVPAVPTAPAAPAPGISIPPTTARGISRGLLYGIIGVVVVAILGYIVIAMVGGGNQQPTPSVAASTSVSPNPELLSEYFGSPTQTIDLTDPATGIDDFISAFSSIQPDAKQANPITINHAGSASDPTTFFDDTIGGIPASLSSAFADDWIVLAYGQTEHYGPTGTLVTTDTSVQPRLAIVVSLIDASSANQAMQAWESEGLASDLAPLFQYDTSKQGMAGFSNGTHQQVPVRYQNFPYADQSLDYAIVTGSNRVNYLVVTGSRESLFFVTNQLMQ